MKTKTAKTKFSLIGQAILDRLRSHGGASNVEAIAASRNATLKNLRSLERSGLIERLDEPTTGGNEPFAAPSDFGVWKLADSPDPEVQSRSCGFCGKNVSYDDHADGTICFEGICACANCLQTDKTFTFRLLLDEENIAYQSRFGEEKTYGRTN